ncbi:MAG TPA: SPOR domain-containing protein [Bacteroidales bacterium]|nr:SPOR domain-containing protein [Bacteroidales bacterium]
MQRSKFIFFVVFLLALAVSGCRAKLMTIPEAPTPAPRGTIDEVGEVVLPDLSPVPTREERFAFASPTDQVIHDANQYFVILGSFQILENANRFVQILRAKGFVPVILISETGMHRVSVDSFNEEPLARTRVNRIRNEFPEHLDSWLLIRRR